jgi:hypothetical protein
MSELTDALVELLSGMGVRSVTEPRRLGGGSSQENWAFDTELETCDGPIVRPLLSSTGKLWATTP